MYGIDKREASARPQNKMSVVIKIVPTPTIRHHVGLGPGGFARGMYGVRARKKFHVDVFDVGRARHEDIPGVW